MNLKSRLKTIYQKLDPQISADELAHDQELARRLADAKKRVGFTESELVKFEYPPDIDHLAENIKQARETHFKRQFGEKIMTKNQ